MINSKDFIAQKNRDSISFAITCGFYIVLFILFAIIPISKPKKYTQISVQLDSLPQKKIEKSVTPVVKEIAQKESVPKVEQKPLEKQIEQKKEVAKTVSQVKPATKTQPEKSQSQPKTQTTQSQSTTQAKSQTATVKKEVVYQKSVEELMAENAKKKKQTATWDDSIFNEETTTSSSVTENTGIFQENAEKNAVSSLEGIAASSSQSANIQTSSVARGESINHEQVSDSTSNALNKISEAKYVTNNSSQTISYETSGILQPRQLIFPSEPSITIPETLENKIVRNRTVKISFIVKSDGSVDVRSIQIEPVGSLVTEIETEIKKQIALWRFESGKSDGQAAFNYSIKVE